MAIDRTASTRSTVSCGLLCRREGVATATPYEVRVLGEGDFPRLRALHDEVVAAAPAGTVALETDAFLARNLAAGGRTFGVLVEGRLIGYGILSFPAGDEDNLAAPWAPDHRRCACLDGAGVLPPWRGNRLQRLLTRLRLDLAAGLGRNHVTAMSSPLNGYSWRNLMASGLAVRQLALKYGGHWRYVLYRDFAQPAPRAAGPAELVPVLDLARQRRLLAAGWIGVEGHVADGQTSMLYVPSAAGRRAAAS
jgi:hypothetical protein